MHHVIDYDQQCKSCKGTGLYAGVGERDGFAVVCHTCKGTRRTRATSSRGISLTVESFGGMPYTDWINGKPFPAGCEDREHTCPAWFYQSAGGDKMPTRTECPCIGGSFSGCKHFAKKAECWKLWDEEFVTP